MEAALHQNKTFDTIDYSDQKLSDNEFVNCEFINCNFSKSDFSSIDFLDCTFKNCNLSLSVLRNTGLKNIKFIGCKLMGLDFSASNSFLFSINLIFLDRKSTRLNSSHNSPSRMPSSA